MWDCRLSGLTVRSEIAIPFAAQQILSADQPDVHIHLVDDLGVPEQIISQGRTYLAGPSDFQFHPHGTLGFRITPDRILVRCSAETPEMEVLTFLLGSAWGVLCHLRGLLPLHCSAVATGDHLFAFAGKTTAGKSTLAAALALRGLDHASDDVVVLGLRDEGIMAHSVSKGIKLTPKQVQEFGLRHGPAVGADTGDAKVYVADMPKGTDGPFSRMSLYVLAENDQISINPVTGPEKLAAVYTNIFRRTWMGTLRPMSDIFQDAARLAQQIPVFTFARPRDMARFSEGIDVLSDHILGNVEQKAYS